MRLHRLTVTAFGPFADTAEVNFDELSDAGLFLLSGATGSGKTSVLDAVCFALYGEVPGDRSAAKRYRCDTAGPGVAPLVELETTLSGRRFRIVRSPMWNRPKKRGEGTTTEQAHVVIEERLEDTWVALSNRIDETGHLITGLVGMNMPQFCQVAMLPQGQFQAFLRARSEERHHLLQQLFSTQRFQDIEHWLREHARHLGREVQGLQRGVTQVVSRLLEATDATLPEDWSADDLTPVMEDDRLRTWAHDQVAAAAAALDQARSSVHSGQAAARAALESREEGHRVASVQDKSRAADAELTRLAARETGQGERRARLVTARRAAPVAPLHRHASETAQQADRAAEASLTARATAMAVLGVDECTATVLADSAREAHRAAAVATALLPREPELDSLRREVVDTKDDIRRLEDEQGALARQLDELPERVTSLSEGLSAAQDSRRRAEELSLAASKLEQRLDAARRLVSLRTDLVGAQENRSNVVDECQRLKEDWLTLREARIAGMAAELAHDLAVGSNCPVCGSADHPQKATPAPGAPSSASEKEVRRLLDDAEAHRTAAEAKVHELSLAIGALEVQVDGATEDSLGIEHAEATALLAAARTSAGRIDVLEPALALARRTLEVAADELSTNRVALATAQAKLKATSMAVEQCARDIDKARGDHPDLESLITSRHRLAETCEAALRLDERAVGARDAAADAGGALSRWLTEHDFSDADEAVAALLDDDETAALEQAIADHEDRRKHARSVLDDPDVAAAAELPPPDLAALDSAHAARATELEAARTELALAQRRQLRLTELSGELETAIDAWAPVRASHSTAAELASFVEGKSADNELRMRLSAYVLAWRLSQVVASANERLVRMSDGRYSLEHTGRRGAGETRGGLSLLVRDEWSGEPRDPATLSGGETFVVSLALALGLADVVTAESGGADLDTLFVDEGFGSLDADTLDDVLDTLDTLRDGGRVIGVVSHVAEMRSRIPTRLDVTKDRAGSTLGITRQLV